MKKGFTLIELLAVIVILAIIAVIATPIILNIIDDTKKESKDRSIDLYLKEVSNEIVFENLNGKFNPSECIIQNDGNLICTDKKGDEKEIKVDMDGDKPTGGTIYFENSTITDYENIQIKDNYYNPGENGAVETPVPKEKICYLSVDAGVSKQADVGDEITCKKDSISESFTVVNTTNNQIDMIAKYNLTLTTTNPIQDTTNKSMGLSGPNNYWYNTTEKKYTVDTNYKNEGREYPYVYGPSFSAYPYIEAYRDVLEGMKINIIDAKIISYEEHKVLETLGKVDNKCEYLTGSAIGDGVWVNERGEVWSNSASTWFSPRLGARVSITIPESEI